jgi:PAS domain S-box-containing protein
MLNAQIHRINDEAAANLQTIAAPDLLRPGGIETVPVGLQNTLAAIVESAPYAIALLDDDFRHLGASDTYCAMLRTDRIAIMGKTCRDLFFPLSGDWEMAQQRCLAGESSTFEHDWTSGSHGKARRMRWQIRPWRKSRARVSGAILFVQVVSASESTKQGNLLTVLDSVPNLVVLAKPNGVLTFMNKAGQQLTGMDQIGGYENRAFADFVRPSNRPIFLGMPLDHNWPDKMLIRNLKTGEEIPMMLTLLKMYDAANVPCGFACIETDTRKQNTYLEDSQTSDLQLQHAQKRESVCELSGRVAHELNNTLLIINGYSSILSEELATDPHLSSEAKAILKAGERTTLLAQKLISLSRL